MSPVHHGSIFTSLNHSAVLARGAPLNRRWTAFWLVGAIVVIGMGTGLFSTGADLLGVDLPGTSFALAQDEAAAPAAGAAAADPAADILAQRKQESFLAWMIRASGIFGFLIMLVSFVMVALLMMLFLQLRKVNYIPADFVEDFEEKLNARDYPGAYELAKSDDSFVARVLAAGMARLARGYEEVENAMQEVGDDEALGMEQKIGYLALIGSVAPMLGLLGTVQGMVLSFQVIATSTQQPKPYELADGIATALFTTLEGLVVAIPAIVGFTVYKNRFARFMFEASVISEGLMSRFSGMKPQAAPAAPAAPAARPAAAAPAAAPQG